MSLESAFCQEFVAEVLRSEKTFYFLSGTSAFSYLLSRSPIPRDRTILLPAFTCEKLLLPLFARNQRFRLVDSHPNWVTPELEQYQTAYTDDTAAIVLIYVWGYAPRELGAIVTWAKSKGLLIIEDVASCFGLSKDGQPFGSLGDYSFGSFGYDKTWELGEGGFCSGSGLSQNSTVGIGRITESYNSVIKFGRRVKLYPARHLLLKTIALYSTGTLTALPEVRKRIYEAIPQMSKTFARPMNTRFANTSRFLQAQGGSGSRQVPAYSFFVPNNDQRIGVRLLAEFRNRNSALKTLRDTKIWVGTDYANPLSRWVFPRSTPNAERLGEGILSFITNERNQTVDQCVGRLNEF